MRYPMHTTGQLESLPALLLQKERRAVWVHVCSDADRLWAQATITKAGWIPLIGLPIFFVAAVRKDTSIEHMNRLRKLIAGTHEQADIEFMGTMFGYAKWETDWYLWAVGLKEMPTIPPGLV